MCSIVAAVVFLGGAGYLLTRPKVYQSVSSVALLPVTSNAGSLPNYPTMIASLIPTYVQLVSSPVLLNRVAATLPFAISEAQLANDVHAEALSNAAVINIVAQSRSAIRATQIASRTTDVFLANLRGNGVVVPRIYAQPTVPTKPAPPSTKLMLAAILALAVILGLVAGLLWDRLFEVGGEEERQRSSRAPPEAPPPSELPEASVPSVLPEAGVPSVLGVIPELAGQRGCQHDSRCAHYLGPSRQVEIAAEQPDVCHGGPSSAFCDHHQCPSRRRQDHRCGQLGRVSRRAWSVGCTGGRGHGWIDPARGIRT